MAFIRTIALSAFLCPILALCAAAVPLAETDTVAATAYAPPTPRISKFSVSANMETIGNSDYYIKEYGHRIEEGHQSHYSKTNVRVSAPVLYWKKILFSLYATYAYIHQDFEPRMQTIDYGMGSKEHHNYTLGINLMSKTKLWGKTLTWVAIAGCDFTKYGYERTTGMLTAILNVKESRETTLGVGLIGLYNTFSNVPLIPIVTYRHTFSPKLSLNLTLPRYHVRYTPNKHDALSLGVGYSSTSVFIKPEDNSDYETCRHTRFSLVPTLLYERTLADGLILSAEGGYSIPVTNRINEYSNTHRIASVHQSPRPLFKIGISYNLY